MATEIEFVCCHVVLDTVESVISINVSDDSSSWIFILIKIRCTMVDVQTIINSGK